ncbi:MAG: S-layer homology domain-containing protein [Clostridiales bacterium]|nr:S-layer homology domain-containing protein [Clostridiales bacterium]
MKKLTSLFLALVLCIGLTVPALATGEQYKELKISTMTDSIITFEAAYKTNTTINIIYGEEPLEQNVQLIVVKPGSKITVKTIGGDETFYDAFAIVYEEEYGCYCDSGAVVELYSGTAEEIFCFESDTLLMMPDFEYFIKLGEGAAAAPTFTDVKADEYYAVPVAWAVKKSITDGTSDTTFSPNVTCSNAQILTFMWRAAGSPESTAANPFTNLTGSEYYAKAAVWAYENGMVSGTSFDADKDCTRSMTVEYFWKQAGSPTTTVSDMFTDVAAGSSYAQAVAWAVENGITDGTSDTTFSPADTCTRGQIVTFLYRALA